MNDLIDVTVRGPRSRAEVNDLRELLEANLATLHSLVQLQARKLKSLEKTRALLYVALKELIVANDNEVTR